MTYMVDRVARAIRKELGVDWPYTGHAELADVATAAIEAMRFTSAEMFTAGQRAVGRMDHRAVKTVDWEQVWRAMIDAALNTKPPGD